VEPGERRFYGIDFVKEAEEQVREIQKNMTAAQARQKSYGDKRRKPIEFEVGDHVYLKVSPMRGVKRFGIKRKLEPRYGGPYQIIEKSGRVAYKLNLSREMGAIFLVFHVSQLKKSLCILEERVAVRRIKLTSDLSYEEKPVQVLDTQERVTRSRVVKLYKVVWSNHSERDATWEREDYLKENYPTFYTKWYAFQILGRDFYKGESCSTLGVWLTPNCISFHKHVYHPSHHANVTETCICNILYYDCFILDCVIGS
jgi:hypothetical protein